MQYVVVRVVAEGYMRKRTKVDTRGRNARERRLARIRSKGKIDYINGRDGRGGREGRVGRQG